MWWKNTYRKVKSTNLNNSGIIIKLLVIWPNGKKVVGPMGLNFHRRPVRNVKNDII
jgi:hypothetical protein